MRSLFAALLLLALSVSQAVSHPAGYLRVGDLSNAGLVAAASGRVAAAGLQGKPLCWHKVLPSSSGRALISGCSPDPRYLAALSLPVLHREGQCTAPAACGRWLGHDPGGPLRPPIA